MLPQPGGGYQVITRAGRDLPVNYANTVEDPTIKAILDPYSSLLDNYNAQQLGQTTAPIDALQAYTGEPLVHCQLMLRLRVEPA